MHNILISYSAAAFKGPFSGHIILYLSKTKLEPRVEIDGPCYGLVVKQIKPGQLINFNDKAVSFPNPLVKIEHGVYYVQAVCDRNIGGRNIGTSVGNLFSITQKVTFPKKAGVVVNLVCDQVVPPQVFEETKYIKEFNAPSALLSNFHHIQQSIYGAVILPKEYYDHPNKEFPVLFIIGGYGSDYHNYSKENKDIEPPKRIYKIPYIQVYLDGNCPLGHSVYANSDNNGPWGDAITSEFIPLLRQQYRCNGAILMKGHSSGGWTVLWLQTHYPELFAGCDASAPDPVDYHSFLQRDLYAGESKIISSPETVLWRGEQDNSFDAVYGPKGEDGNPIPLYHPITGKMNNRVLQHWKRYDLSRYLLKNWKQLKFILAGKIRISVGNEDTYSLNLSVEKLEKTMKQINADITFAFFPGDHFSVMTTAYKKASAAFLSKIYHKWLLQKQLHISSLKKNR